MENIFLRTSVQPLALNEECLILATAHHQNQRS